MLQEPHSRLEDPSEGLEEELEEEPEEELEEVPLKTQHKEPSEDLEELARFREEWKEEVRRRKGGDDLQISNEDAVSITPSNPVKLPELSTREDKPVILGDVSPGPSNVPGSPKAARPEVPLPPQLIKALDIYRRAISCEQRSELETALQLYRQAFRLHEDVDKVYERLEFSQHNARVHLSTGAADVVASISGPTTASPPQGHFNDVGVENVIRTIEQMTVSTIDSKLPAIHGSVTGLLAKLIATWPSNLSFDPEDEKEPVHLQMLPEEVFVHILQQLDVTSLERFAAVNRKARILTLDTSIWRRYVKAIYKPPQIPDDEDVGALVMKYKEDFRHVYIEHPRIRLDGVYIAVCHYIRQGLSENAWVNVSHLITYHRYLRFYSTGQVLSLLANEGVGPQQVIPMLKPTLQMKGFHIGNWRLEGTTVYITDLMDASGIPSRYTFQMILELRSRPLGRWNRLDFRAYDTVAIESGEATPLALKNDRPFWFSKVRSYGSSN